MTTIQELIAQKAALEQQIAEVQQQAKADGIAKIRALMAEHGLTVADLSEVRPSGKSKTGKGQKVAPKYKDPETGKQPGRSLLRRIELEHSRRMRRFGSSPFTILPIMCLL